jgi:hypothetical protein
MEERSSLLCFLLYSVESLVAFLGHASSDIGMLQSGTFSHGSQAGFSRSNTELVNFARKVLLVLKLSTVRRLDRTDKLD